VFVHLLSLARQIFKDVEPARRALESAGYHRATTQAKSAPI
jgi:hypothetical protein